MIAFRAFTNSWTLLQLSLICGDDDGGDAPCGGDVTCGGARRF